MRTLDYPELHHVRAAEGWLELGDPAEAARELRHLPARALAHPDVLELRWRLYAAERQWDAALDIARAITLAAPERSSGWIHRSYCLHELRRTEEAWQLLLPLADQFPGEATIAYNLACYACQMGRGSEARTWLSRAMKLGGKAEIRDLALDDPDLAPLHAYLRTL
ncbi:MAG: TPR end-of-group domain-containing protein [Verrucomicrobiota bacterium]